MNTIYYIYGLAYFLGAIPFGVVYGYIFCGKDVRGQGSGNIGATNAWRLGGRIVGGLTVISDIFKGYLAVTIAQKYSLNPYIAGMLVTAGHIFPIWLMFRGGKGVATALGAVMPLSHLLAINSVAIWLLTFYCFRISSLAALVSFGMLPLLAWIYGISIPWSIFLSALIIFTHRHNITRLFKHQEKPLI